jgi:hypothetical protein
VPERYKGYFWISLNGMANVYGGSQPGEFTALPSDVLMGYWKPAIRKGVNTLSMVIMPVTQGPVTLQSNFYAFTDVKEGAAKGVYAKRIAAFRIGTV